MKPLDDWPRADRRAITGVFTDIDDTLTTEGAITPDALAALHHLRAAGYCVIAITGRPVGWSQPFALTWPVDAIVAENGSVALLAPVEGPAPQHARLRQAQSERVGMIDSPQPERIGVPPSSAPEQMGTLQSDEQLRRLYQQDAATRQANYVRLQAVGQRIVREVPGATLAQDSAGRETDLAIDHSEFTHLPPERIAQVVAIMHSEGMHASVSSIHINGWYGDHNKWQGACWIVRELFGRDLSLETDQWAFVGDSTNDQLMFEAFDNSVGVANIARFADQLTHAPRYVARQERGAGFAEVAAALLAARE